mmetsp:Transcript_1246/g.1125  ORF Transcript_1246/g.1125 Transcript_1246/m.1125 type:complete len:137 (-) Transcript_1246:462-872(-)
MKKKTCLTWLVPGPSNFKGGNHWLTKTQYDIYQLSQREIRSGMITENQDNLVMRIFHQQRMELENKRLDDRDKSEIQQKSLQENFAKSKNQTFYQHIENDFLSSLKMRANKIRKKESEANQIVHHEDIKLEEQKEE